MQRKPRKTSDHFVEANGDLNKELRIKRHKVESTSAQQGHLKHLAHLLHVIITLLVQMTA